MLDTWYFFGSTQRGGLGPCGGIWEGKEGQERGYYQLGGNRWRGNSAEDKPERRGVPPVIEAVTPHNHIRVETYAQRTFPGHLFGQRTVVRSIFWTYVGGRAWLLRWEMTTFGALRPTRSSHYPTIYLGSGLSFDAIFKKFSERGLASCTAAVAG